MHPSTDINDLVRQSILVLALIIAAAKIGGELMSRIGQPPVLGELLVGVLLGNLNLFGITVLEPLRDNATLSTVAEIGVILLMFQVGVESDLIQLLAVGWSSLAVALLGVSASLGLGYLLSALLNPRAAWITHLFVGGAIMATSIGITARVLRDLGKSNSREAHVILGAAVADDVIGLIVLAVASGLTLASAGTHPGSGAASVLWIVAKALLFLILAAVVGRLVARGLFSQAARLRVPGTLLALSICFCFGIAALAGLAGLAPLIGAFAAGLLLEEIHLQPFLNRGERSIEELLVPVASLIVPVFFVMTGFRVDITSFASPRVLGFALLLTIAAVAGKQVCALGVRARGVNRWAVAFGMLPRGEVSLIFAGIGSAAMVLGRPVLSRDAYAAIVLTVMLTTALTPPVLKSILTRDRPAS